ncbi:MAG: hypothetical protein WA667_03330 [Candidatus Nitrosopolaris sp.]
MILHYVFSIQQRVNKQNDSNKIDIDSSSGLHKSVVDPENGKVLLAYQPMSMTGPFSQ